ncbi:formin-like protein 14 [Prunus yedoensis var. nudiflora]|uniref:Formin-like protein 14 n=1 Tax=Prunus yedoensis var. nudiflora TaxID=2094558 RepID=A0A314YXK8_PRUYE|nr:formin-like protein 14 [Prunus yedoensis var. nudiflora]
MVDKEKEHMTLLLLWLNQFIFPNPEGFVQHEYVHLAEALHNEDVATCPFILPSLYHCLHQITTKSMDLNGKLDYPEDEIPTITLVSSPIKSVKIEECFILFCDCNNREERQWLRSVIRGCPWFMNRRIYELDAEDTTLIP